jgi:hypothetical protein
VTSQPPSLEALVFHWGDAFLFFYSRDRWVALRRDNHLIIAADTLTQLEAEIQFEYEKNPVPRDFDPPDATNYLDAEDEDQDEADDGLDAETHIILLELRQLFPDWTITYSSQMRVWVAQTSQATICELSPA